VQGVEGEVAAAAQPVGGPRHLESFCQARTPERFSLSAISVTL
jgi:hypothetical protein